MESLHRIAEVPSSFPDDYDFVAYVVDGVDVEDVVDEATSVDPCENYGSVDFDSAGELEMVEFCIVTQTENRNRIYYLTILFILHN